MGKSYSAATISLPFKHTEVVWSHAKSYYNNKISQNMFPLEAVKEM
jgi:hypothetical protein